MSINNEAKTTKLVTQWNISAINYNANGNTAFEGSYMQQWLNDTTVDGFLENLRDYENFIVTDAKWNATLDATDLGSITRPNGESVSTNAVGLLNAYEYQSSNNGETDAYLNNGLEWWGLTPYSSSYVCIIGHNGKISKTFPANQFGVRPSINLKTDVKIVDGNGTIDNPYRLEEDNDTNLTGELLSSRYSGEYIRFGTGENNLYRIVSHETEGLTKITSSEPLKENGEFKKLVFDSSDNVNYSSTNTIGTFLNGEYLMNYVGGPYIDMIEENTIWYLGTVGSESSYKLAKYTDENGTILTSNTTNAKVGLLRLGELMSGQFDRYDNNTDYWMLTPRNSSSIFFIFGYGYTFNNRPTYVSGMHSSMNLKSNVIITGGDGTKNNPFTLKLG